MRHCLRDSRGECLSPCSPCYLFSLSLLSRDMQVRISFWCSLTELGWELPPKEPVSKAEYIEEERIHKAIKEAMESAKDEDTQTPCRSVRVFLGYKAIPQYSNDPDAIQ